MLTQINGDMDGFIERMTTGKTVQEGYIQAQESWANQWDKFTASILAGNKAISGFMDRIGAPALGGLTELINYMTKFSDESKEMKTAIDSLIPTILGVMTYIGGMKLATKLLATSTISDLTLIKAGWLSYGFTLKSVNMTLAVLGKTMKTMLMANLPLLLLMGGLEAINIANSHAAQELEKQELATSKSMDRAKLGFDTTQKWLNSKKQIEDNKKEILEISKIDISEGWRNANIVLDATVEKFKTLKDLMNNISDFTLNMNKSVNTEEFKKQRDIISRKAASEGQITKSKNIDPLKTEAVYAFAGTKKDIVSEGLDTAAGFASKEQAFTQFVEGKIAKIGEFTSVVSKYISDQDKLNSYIDEAKVARAEYVASLASESTEGINNLKALSESLRLAQQNIADFSMETKKDIISQSSFKNIDEYVKKVNQLYKLDIKPKAGDLYSTVEEKINKQIDYEGKQKLRNDLIDTLEKQVSEFDAYVKLKSKVSAMKDPDVLSKGILATMENSATVKAFKDDTELKNKIKGTVALLKEMGVIDKENLDATKKENVLILENSNNRAIELQNLYKINSTQYEQLKIENDILDINYKKDKLNIESEIRYNKNILAISKITDLSRTQLESEINRIKALDIIDKNDEKKLKSFQEILKLYDDQATLDLRYSNSKVESLNKQLKLQSDINSKNLELAEIGVDELSLRRAKADYMKAQLGIEKDDLTRAQLRVDIAKANVEIKQQEINKAKELRDIEFERAGITDKIALLYADEGDQISLNYKVEQERIRNKKQEYEKDIENRKEAVKKAKFNAGTAFQESSITVATMEKLDQGKFTAEEKIAFEDKLKKAKITLKANEDLYDIATKTVAEGDKELEITKLLLKLLGLKVEVAANDAKHYKESVAYKSKGIDFQLEENRLNYDKASIYRDLTQTQKLDLIDAEKNALIGKQKLILDHDSLEYKQLGLDINKKDIETEKQKIEYLRQQVDLVSSYVNALSKGESINFDTSGAIGKAGIGVSNLLSGKGSQGDYESMIVGTMGVITNMQNATLDKEAKNISNRLELYDMQKQLATSEEERQSIDEKILADKKAQIDLEMKKQTGFMGATGASGSALGGAVQGAVTGNTLLPGGTGAILGGVLGLVTGLFGGNEAEKQAEIAKQQLEKQEEMRKLLEIQAKNGKFLSEWITKASSLGVKKGLESSLYSTGISIASYTDARGSTAEGGNFKTIQDLELKAKEYRQKVKDFVASQGSSTKETEQSYKIMFPWMYVATLMEQEIMKINKNKETLGKAYFGFEVAQMENSTELYIKEWSKRTDFMNKFVENAKTGMSNVGDFIGEYLGDSFTNAWVRNDDTMNKYLDDFAEKVSTFSNQVADKETMAKALGMSKEDIAKVTTESDNKEATTIYNMQQMVLLSKDMEAQQKVLNQDTSNFASLWGKVGGSISSIISMMPEFSKNLYESMRGAMLETNFVDRFNKIGDGLASAIGDKLSKSIFDKKFSDRFITLNDEITKIMSNGDGTTQDFMNIRNQLQQYSSSIEGESLQLRAKLDMLKLSNNSEYTSVSQPTEYTTSSSQTNVYNVSNTINITGTLISDKNSMQQLSDQMISYLDTSFRNQGIILGS